MKYKAYITDSEKIFWTKNSVDKPTKDYFLDLMNTIEWTDLGNITPNFLNQFNGSIVVDKDTYTYLKLINTETNEVKYFSIDSVNKVLNNGYVIDITLDVFTTYTLFFYESIKDKPIKVNRTTSFGVFKNNPNAQLQQDELIPIPFSPYVINYSADDGLKSGLVFQNKESDNTRWYRYRMTNSNEWILIERKQTQPAIYSINSGGTNPRELMCYLYSLTIFDVFQDVNGDWYFVPDFGYETIEKGYGDAIIYGKFIKSLNNSDDYYQFFNHKNFIKKVRDSTFWVNKYKGKFYIPKWINLAECCIPVMVETRQNDDGYYILMLKIKDSLFDNYRRLNHSDLYFNLSSLCINEFNIFNDKPNSYAFSKITNLDNTYNILDIFNGSLEKTKLFIDRDYKNIKIWINQSNGIVWINKLHNLNVLLIGNETFPTTTNDYISYMSSVQSQQNTQIQVAKQNAITSGIKSVFGGVLGFVGSAVSGNPIGAISSLFNTATGVADSVMQYQNKKREIDAQNADKQRSSTASQINPTSINSTISNSSINSFGLNGSAIIDIRNTDGIIVNNPFNKEMSFYYNKTVWESGYKVDQMYRLNDPHNYQIDFFDDYINQFIYWDLEIPTEYIKFTYPNYNNELIYAISTTINNPVRFWKIQPDYLTNLKMELLERN